MPPLTYTHGLEEAPAYVITSYLNPKNNRQQ